MLTACSWPDIAKCSRDGEHSVVASRKRLREIEDRQRAERFEAYTAQEAKGSAIYRRLYKLEESSDRSRIGEDVLNLLKYARSQTGAIRQSIADRSQVDFSGEPPTEGDVATALADDIASVLREHTCDPQTVWAALSEALPEVKFTVDIYDAVSMIAAMLRQQELIGVVHGLELAGIHVPQLDPELD
jgi:hypothetical protein